VTFQPGSKIDFYWQRSINDTGKVYFILRYYRDDFYSPDGPGDTVIVKQGGVTAQKYTMTVVGSGYNTVEVKMDGSQGWKPIYMDAIVLVQHGTITTNPAGVASSPVKVDNFVCSPNPFPAMQGTTLWAEVFDEGYNLSGVTRVGSFVVMDVLGREVATIEARRQAHISVPSNGTYFVRYRVGGEWVGAPFRIVAE
jgi:hypothetical protein